MQNLPYGKIFLNEENCCDDDSKKPKEPESSKQKCDMHRREVKGIKKFQIANEWVIFIKGIDKTKGPR